MTARATIGGILASASVLAIAWLTGSTLSSSQAPVSSAPATSAGSAGSSDRSGSGPATSAPAPTSAAAQAGDGTYTGDSIATRYGDVQVEVDVSGGRIVDVTALKLTDHDGRSVSISNRAAPVLRQEVLDAQSSSVRMVSGATYTSQGYLSSLQSALDKAGL